MLPRARAPRPILLRYIRCWATLAALLASLSVDAGSFIAHPIKLVLPAGAMTTSLALQNTGEDAVLVQAQLMSWSQSDGQDVLAPTEDLVVSPPIFKVAPGATQTVRLGLLKRPQASRETAYRLFLEEVVTPARAGEQQGVSVALRLGLPVFVLPSGGALPRVTATARLQKDALRITLANDGTGHVQALDCKLVREDGTVLAQRTLGAYVLAGETRSWIIAVDRIARGARLSTITQTSTGSITTDVVVE